LRQQQPAPQAIHRRLDLQRAQPWRRRLRERQFVLVDVAERDDARQHRGIGIQFIEKDFPRHPPGAPGRQIERRLRQPFRIGARLKTFDEPAIDQRGNDAAQEWR
jgi:hypothetical protein